MAVFIGSTPNTQEDDVLLAKKILRGDVDLSDSIIHTHQLLQKILGLQDKNNLFLFNRGRDSLYFFLRLLGLKEKDEVIMQGFTCVAVVAPILWQGANPKYVDIDADTFNMDLGLLEKKLSKGTRVVIIQHTFGNIVDTKAVREIIDRENLARKENEKIYLIEDCAHLFPSPNSSQSVGLYSDMYFFSFSQDKSTSSTQGAVMVINNGKFLRLAKKQYKNIKEPLQKEAFYNARYIKFWDTIKRTYFTKLIPFTKITLGRVLIMVFRFFGLIKKQATVNTTEDIRIRRMSNVQAVLLEKQLLKVKDFNEHRERITNIYNKNLKKEFRYNSNTKNLLRYPVLITNREEIKEELLKENVIIGNWYSTPVYPLDNNELPGVRYLSGMCPNVENVGENIINLPTNIAISEKLALKIVDIINTFAMPLNI